jgi:hypothetical protein
MVRPNSFPDNREKKILPPAGCGLHEKNMKKNTVVPWDDVFVQSLASSVFMRGLCGLYQNINLLSVRRPCVRIVLILPNA